MRHTGQSPLSSEVPNRFGSFLRMGVAYVLAVCVGAAVLWWMNAPPIESLFWADVAGTVVIFGTSVYWNNSSLYDPYWSVAPLAILAGLWASAPHPVAAALLLPAAALVLWAVRLTWNFFRGWPGLEHEDWRYVNFREQWGKGYWLVSFLGIHFFPTLLVFVALLPFLQTLAIPELHSPVWAVAGGAISLVGTALEGVADNQLRRFRRGRSSSSGEIMESGVWAWCRHPNYLGEWLFWLGMGLTGFAGPGAGHTAWMGPAAILALFLFASIPMIDKRSLARRPGYAEVMATRPAFFPRPPRGPGGKA